MNRRSRILPVDSRGSSIVFAAAALVLLIASCRSASPGSAGDRTNIVVIMVDDMGYSDIGSFGGEIDTPNIDRMAEGGVRFTQFYNTATCFPTRASLMTGLYAHQVGMGFEPGTLTNGVTIAEVLRLHRAA